MLNHIALDEDDRKILQNSFNQISNEAEIVSDKEIIQTLSNRFTSALTIPNGAVFSFQNLFKLSINGSAIYIGQCLLDFGYPVKGKMTYSQTRVYELQIVGYAELEHNLGDTFLRPENKLDKLISKFWRKGIKFENLEKFNANYYLVSDNRQAVKNFFDNDFVNSIGKNKNILMTIKSKEMFITFASQIQVEQCKIIEQIFKKCKFLRTSYGS